MKRWLILLCAAVLLAAALGGCGSREVTDKGTLVQNTWTWA